MSVTRLFVTGFGALWVVYVTLIAGAELIRVATGDWNFNDGTARSSACMSARAVASVAWGPLATTMRTRLFLSRKTTRGPLPLCAHPSGYLIA